MGVGALALVFLLATPLPGRAAPQDAPPASVPLPPERPQDLTPPPPPGEAIKAAPTPPERPAELTPAVQTDTKADTKLDGKLDAKPEAPAPTAESGKSEAAQPTPLPPARPPELSGEAALALKVAAPTTPPAAPA